MNDCWHLRHWYSAHELLIPRKSDSFEGKNGYVFHRYLYWPKNSNKLSKYCLKCLKRNTSFDSFRSKCWRNAGFSVLSKSSSSVSSFIIRVPKSDSTSEVVRFVLVVEEVIVWSFNGLSVVSLEGTIVEESMLSSASLPINETIFKKIDIKIAICD